MVKNISPDIMEGASLRRKMTVNSQTFNDFKSKHLQTSCQNKNFKNLD